ncbi:MAG TPA: tetratricopeptide repeat protein [Blastocatellia bacterium]|nr:tetratricopeptide repeat protein [Blastocatellia bacterium]
MFVSHSSALRAAERYLRRRKLAASIARYERRVERDPQDLTAANSLGDLYVRAGRVPEAVAVFSAMADHYCAEGFLPRAIAMLKKVIRVSPDSVEELGMLAELSQQVGRKAEAIEYHRRLENLLNHSPRPRKAIDVGNRIGIVPFDHPAEPDTPRAINASFDKRQLSEDEFVIKQIFLAEVLAIRGGVDEAITILREILSLAPDNVPARSKLKDVYLRAGLADLAANECLQLARIRESRKMAAIGYLANEIKFGLIDPPSGEESPSFAQDANLGPRFEAFAKPPGSPNRRRAARVGMSLPVLVISDDGGWREFAESVNSSRSGLLLRLAHSVNPSSRLRATMPMPFKLRASQSTKGLYVVNGVVRHALPDPGGDNLVGIEFEGDAQSPEQPSMLSMDCNEALTPE